MCGPSPVSSCLPARLLALVLVIACGLSAVASAAALAAPAPAASAASATRPERAQGVAAPAASSGARWPQAGVEPLQAAMARGALTSRRLTADSLDRIRRLDQAGPRTRALLQTHPEALAQARRLDRERQRSGPRSLLHGIPVVLKDNIDTGDGMRTTAGSLAMAAAPAPRDAFIVQRLRQAGALILGKTNLSEWANIRSSRSISGWSAVGGQTRNPYDLARNPCGSSSGTGTAVAAGYAVVGIGTETDGSIVCPASAAGLVGIKPTVGLVSRAGIVPISASQDTAGPMARSVRDAAIVLGVIAGVDPADPATQAAQGHVQADYLRFLVPDGLKGARIGVARKRVTGYNAHTDRLFEQALADLKRLGAELVDPADFGHLGEYDDEELDVLLYEFKDGLDRYLAGRPGLPVRSLADVIAFNERHAEREMPFFGQDLFLKAQALGPLTDPAYQAAAQKARSLARAGIDEVLRQHRLDAIVAPTGSPAWLTDTVNGDAFQGSSASPAAVAGYPAVTVPMGLAAGLPVGLSFVGTAWSEPSLLRLAHAYESGTQRRRPPVLKEAP